MKDILRSKIMVGFMVLLVGFFYISARDTKKMDESHQESTNQYVYVNM
ncbi:MAG: hypothetical protein PHN72_04470 [Bacilli bacterium]|nr:hypothetical protein [Bacilli bacterium]